MDFYDKSKINGLLDKLAGCVGNGVVGALVYGCEALDQVKD